RACSSSPAGTLYALGEVGACAAAGVADAMITAAIAVAAMVVDVRAVDARAVEAKAVEMRLERMSFPLFFPVEARVGGETNGEGENPGKFFHDRRRSLSCGCSTRAHQLAEIERLAN